MEKRKLFFGRSLATLEAYASQRVDSYECQFRMYHKSRGRYVWIKSRGSVFSDSSGARYIAGVHVDVTDEMNRAMLHRNALDAVDGMYVFAKDRELKFTFANRALQNVLERDPVGLKDKDVFTDARSVQLFNEVDQVVLERATCGVRVLGGTLRVESRITIAEEYFDDAKGRRRYLATVKQPVFMPDGSIELLGVAIDITELREVRMHLSAIMNSPAECVYVKDLSGRFTYANAGFARALNAVSGDIVGRSDNELFPKAQAEEWQREEAEIVRTGIPVVQSPRLIYSQGVAPSIRLVTKLPLRDSFGRTEGILGIGTDVTSLIHEVDEVWQRAHAVRLCEMRSGVNVFIKDRFGRFVFVNDEFVRRHGRSNINEVIGTTDYDWWPCELAERYRSGDRRVLSYERPLAPFVEEQYRREMRSVLLTAKAPLYGRNGRAIAVLGAYVDITEVLLTFASPTILRTEMPVGS